MGWTCRKYTEEILRDAVARSTSVAGVLRVLDLAQAGGTHAHISRTIKRFGIDTSHFVRFQNGSKGRRRTAENILVRTTPGSGRTRSTLLRRALLEIGREYKCGMCQNPGQWLGADLRLEVDHRDGDIHNNEEWNLRFLCPNCHSQTENFSGRSRGKVVARVGQLPRFESVPASSD
jgi:5-methylcytosine-specific restriction endonuclease McrA